MDNVQPSGVYDPAILIRSAARQGARRHAVALQPWQTHVQPGDHYVILDSEPLIYGEILRTAEPLPNYHFVCCYSARCPEGTVGVIHGGRLDGLLSATAFAQACASGWPATHTGFAQVVAGDSRWVRTTVDGWVFTPAATPAPAAEPATSVSRLAIALGLFPAIQINRSGEDGPAPDHGHETARTWAVTFSIMPTMAGWLTIDFLAWLINHVLRHSAGIDILFQPVALSPAKSVSGSGSQWRIEGGTDVCPDIIAALVDRVRASFLAGLAHGGCRDGT